MIQIGEHKLPIPQPLRKSDIFYINEKPEEAYWRRIVFPEFFYKFRPYKSRQEPGTRIYQAATIYDQDENLISLSEDDSKILRRCLEEDLHRRMYGFHMKNRDKILWVAPDYYFTLQWGAMKDLSKDNKYGRHIFREADLQYGDYRHCQNDCMILWEFTKRIDWSAGLMIAKAKKTGLTQIFAGGSFVNEATLQSNMEFGMASKEFDHVKAVAMSYFFYAYDQLPLIMKPETRGRNLTEIKFGQQPQRGGAVKLDTHSSSILNNRVNGYKTKVNCFDGPVMKRGLIDELPKWWESSNMSPDLVLKTNVEAVKLNQVINGKLIIFSYMPEVDDRGFREFKKWFFNSKLRTKGPNGRTTSQMICHTLTAVQSNEGCFDMWGYTDEGKAYDMVMADYNSKTTVADRLAHRRQYMKDENDAFDAGGKGTVFDNIRIGEWHRELELALNTGVQQWKYAKLEWENEAYESGIKDIRPKGKFSAVRLRYATDEEIESGECDNYPLHVYHELPDELLNQVIKKNNRHSEDECYKPISWKKGASFIASWDPVDYVVKQDIRDGSANAGHGGFIYDPAMNTRYRKSLTNTPVYEYHFRHDDPDEDFENLVKLIILYGVRIVVEANKKWVVTALKKEGLHRFLLLKQKDGSITPYKDGDENILVNATGDMINVYTLAIKRWIAKPKNDNSDFDFLRSYRSIDGLEQLMNFDPTDTKRWDIAVSLGWWRLAMESFIAWTMTAEAEDDDDDTSDDMAEGMLTILEVLCGL